MKCGLKSIAVIYLLFVFAMVVFAQQGTTMTSPISSIVKELSIRYGVDIVFVEDNKEPITFPVHSDLTLEQTLQRLATVGGYTTWKSGDKYYIGIHEIEKTAIAPDKLPLANIRSTDSSKKIGDITTLSVDVLPTTSNGYNTQPISGAATTNPGIISATASKYYSSTKEHDTLRPQPVNYRIVLKYTSALELAWLLDPSSNPFAPDLQQKRMLVNRYQTIFNPRQKSTIDVDYYNGNYVSPMIGGRSYYDTGYTGNNGTSAAAYQIGLPGGGPVGGFSGGTLNAGNNIRAGGGLADFLPRGIGKIVGVESLNVLLVTAYDGPMIDADGNLMIGPDGQPTMNSATNLPNKYDGQDTIMKLLDIIELIDQPAKQVIIELMFVKMSIADATNLGSSWSIPGTPWEATATNQLDNQYNFSLLYMKDNIKFQMQSLQTNNKAKVTNAPRVIVQNGADAYIRFSRNIPYYVTTTEEDAFGRVTTNVNIQAQQVQQGMNVHKVIINDEGFVTMWIEPLIEDIADALQLGAIGGGSIGEVATTEVNTVVRVRSGRSVMMGGFITTTSVVDKKKIPFLSDIPLLGELFFSQRRETIEESETVILLTPTIMEDDATDFGMMVIPAMM